MIAFLWYPNEQHKLINPLQHDLVIYHVPSIVQLVDRYLHNELAKTSVVAVLSDCAAGHNYYQTLLELEI